MQSLLTLTYLIKRLVHVHIQMIFPSFLIAECQCFALEIWFIKICKRILSRQVFEFEKHIVPTMLLLVFVAVCLF